MGQSHIYANLENIRGFFQLTKVPTIEIILFLEFIILISKNNAISPQYSAITGSVFVKLV